MKKTLFITIIVLFIVGCSCLPLPHPMPTPTPKTEGPGSIDDYEVLSTLLEYAAGGSSQYVIVDTSTPGFGFDESSADQFDYLNEQLPELTHEMIESWMAANNEVMVWEDSFDLDAPVVLISNSDLDKLLDDVYWTGFHTQFPDVGGFFELSHPGYNADGDLALVYMSFSAGSLAANGTFYLLAYENGVWQVVGEAMLWIS
jgi:hypothetical protein